MKKLKKILSFLMVLVIMAGFAVPSYAASLNFSIYPNSTKKSVQVVGTSDPGKVLTFYVTDSGISPKDMTFENNFYALHQETVNSKGNFDVKMKLPDNMPGGNYRVIIGGFENGAVAESARVKDFSYSPSDVQAYTVEAEDATGGIANWDLESGSSASNGTYIKIFDDNPSFKNTDAALTWNIDVKAPAQYDIFALTIGSGEHLSGHSFSVNGDKASTGAEYLTSPLYQAYMGNYYAADMYWAKVRTDVFIDKGNASITYTPQYSSLFPNRILTGIDAIYVVPSDWNWEPYKLVAPVDENSLNLEFSLGDVNETTITRGGKISGSVDVAATTMLEYDAPVWIELRYKGERVVRSRYIAPLESWPEGLPVSVNFEMDVPVVAPDGEYEVYSGAGTSAGFYGESGDKLIGTVTLGNVTEPDPDILKIASASAVQDGKELIVSYKLSDAAEAGSAKVFVRFMKDDVLWGVAESEQKADVSRTDETIGVTLNMPSGMPSGTYDAVLGFYNVNGTRTIGEMEIVSDAKNTYKPLSYGIYKAQKTGRQHFWYINQHGAAIWDGEPFVPMGGMYCPNILHGYYSFINPENNAVTWAEDKREIDMLVENGIKDIYLNASINGTPNWVWEYVLDYLDNNGIRYGIQPNGGNGYTEQDAFYIFSNASKIGTTISASAAGDVPVSYSKKITSVGNATANYAIYTVVNSSGNAVSAGKANLTADGSNYTFSANVAVPAAGNYTVYFTPNVNKNAGVVNFWKYGDVMIEKAQNFARKVAMGDGARDIIDHATNESGYYNYTANARPYDDAYNALYSSWLSKKYKTIGELNDAWKTDDYISGFDQASRIIPVYTGNASADNAYFIWGYDEEKGKVFEFNGRTTQMWMDYIEFRDYAAAEFYNDLADAYKTKLDLPTVIKSVYFHQESFKNQRTYGGLDGLGSESYAVGDGVGQKHTVTYALANQFAKTAWNIVTETNVEENITAKHASAYGENPTYGDNGQPNLVDSNGLGYGTKERMHTNFDQLFDSGAKGVYDFVLGARHSSIIQQAYSYIYLNDHYKSTNDQFSWLAEYKAKVDANKETIANSDPDKNIIYFTPAAAYTNGGGPNRFNAAYIQDHSTITYSYRANGKNRNYMVLLTDDPNVETEIIAANFEKGPISGKQGVAFGKMLETMPKDKQAVYLGFRSDIGTVPQIDKYFTNEYVRNSSGVKVQVLNPGATGEVIYSVGNKPWAIRDGNLWIIAAENWISSGRLNYIDDIGIFMDSADTVFEDFEFKNDSGNTMETISEGNGTVSVLVKNNTGDETDAVLYAASYDADGKLINVSKKTRTIFRGLNYLETDLELSGDAASAKGFVWDKDMNSLINNIEIEK